MNFFSRAGLLVALPVLLLGLLLGGVVAVPTAGAAPLPRDTLFPAQGNPGYDVRSYSVALDYAPATNRLRAVATIISRTPKRLSSYHLDLEGMRVAAVLVNGQRAQVRRTADELVITPRHAVTDRFRTVVSYSGTPREHTDADGSVEGWVRTADGAVALGEPVGTMTWLPSNNTPGDKATYRFAVTVPRGYQAVANGDLVSRRGHGAAQTWTWRMAQPMSTYLATVGVGHYRVTSSSTPSITGRKIALRSFVDPTTSGAADALSLLPKVLRFEEKRFGAYPFGSSGLLVDDADVGYALETQSRPFFPGGVDETTLVHELAHQWYGDSLTLTDWHDIWLAEGFATYAEWLWTAAHGGQSPAAQFDSLYATPADSDLWHPAPRKFKSSAQLFGSPVYTRGAMTLQALRERIGAGAFFHVLRAWATGHRHGSVRTAQLVRLAERISGQQLDGLFADWLDHDGRPAGY